MRELCFGQKYTVTSRFASDPLIVDLFIEEKTIFYRKNSTFLPKVLF